MEKVQLKQDLILRELLHVWDQTTSSAVAAAVRTCHLCVSFSPLYRSLSSLVYSWCPVISLWDVPPCLTRKKSLFL